MSTLAETKTANQSRWGYHSCNYEEYMALKHAHKLLYRAYCDVKRFMRWDRKINRPATPPRHPPNCVLHHQWHKAGKKIWFGTGFLTYEKRNLYEYVLEQYRIAKQPAATETEVQKLQLPPNLGSLTAELEKFYSAVSDVADKDGMDTSSRLHEPQGGNS